MDSSLTSSFCHGLDAPTGASCHMAVSDDHREKDGLGSWVVLSQKVGHVFQSTVDVGAFSQVTDPSQAPDEVLPGGERAEDNLSLGEMQASYGPADLDLAVVLFISQLLGKDLRELFDLFHQNPRWRLL